MYKQLMLLGLLLEKPMYGQQIREVIENHHDFLANHIKKPTIYYQLERLASDGYLEIRHESVEAPGPGAAHDDIALREREVYYITDAGRQYFYKLLRKMLSTYTPALDEVDASIFFLNHLSPEEACTLLTERYNLVMSHRNMVIKQMEGHHNIDKAHQLVNEHKLTLFDAELHWLQNTIAHLRSPSAAPAGE
ncbi:PadR family transcriptional regulator [Ktedonosporobacter rubrisoli]|uniref:PadR family transcriptional regulator n=1 Tax=Ktedonosporobacter rubrisoli TaxID=2509675 RepID=A0A4P6JU73_KTERU|nr:PadR family transcriptional regulator [Ktedonosporobacter rubrisoli]QBD79178.1 PadR family transcriptional regulator [Ktedonosporobacter rubrisoli]